MPARRYPAIITFGMYYKFTFLLLLSLCFASGSVSAQTMGEMPTANNAAQWQLTLDVVKAKLRTLMDQNNQLNAQYRSLQAQEQDLLRMVETQGKKNEDLREFLRERNGKTDQQARIEELENRLQARRAVLPALEKEAGALRKEAEAWQHTVDLKTLRISDWQLRHNTPGASVPVPPPSDSVAAIVPSGDLELDGLRQELEAQKTREADLENQLSSWAQDAQDPQAGILRQKATFLRKQKEDLLAKVSKQDTGGRVNYDLMMQQKAQLEANIRAFEARINTLKDLKAAGFSPEGQNKELVREVVRVDARNTQMRQKVNNLREDIVILREQIAVLEKKMNGGPYGKGK